MAFVKLNRQVIRRVVVGVDWGFTNSGVLLVAAVDFDGRIYIVHEVYRVQKTIDWWIGKAKAIQAHFQPEAYVCDPSSPGFIEQFVRAGLPAIKANNDIALGIQLVQERLRPAGDGRPRLFIFRDALDERDPELAAASKPCCAAEEMDSYVWPTGQDGRAQKETPVDDHNHGLDACRYIVLYLDSQGIPTNRTAVAPPRPPLAGPVRHR